jgi:hypothetical protein
MRVPFSLILMVGSVGLAVGCGYGPKPYYEGPKVSSFSGRVVQDGKPVTFPDSEEVRVVFTVIEGDSMGKNFGVAIKPDGSFSIGWMPIGKMAMRLEREPKDVSKSVGGGLSRYSIPGTLITEEGKTAGYTIELGKSWKH